MRDFEIVFLVEPPRTQFDLHFHLGRVPVRVHPLFWLAALFLSGLRGEPISILLWVGVVFVSILVHELGHVFAMQRFGSSGRVVLYVLGGLAIADSDFAGWGRSRRRGPWEQVIISAAGPVAGFLLAGLVVLAVFASGGRVELVRSFPLFWSVDLPVASTKDGLIWFELVFYLLQVNIFWGLINLLPVYPLDGGQIARELFQLRDPWNGVVQSLWVSVFAAGGLALLALASRRLFLAIMFGMLAFNSFQMLQQLRGGGYGGGRPW